MPSIWQSSAMVSSPRNPSSTMRIFSSAEYCLRFMFHLHSPMGDYDEPETLSYTMRLVCPIGVDVRHILSNKKLR